MPEVKGKLGHFIGQIQSVMACIVQIQGLKKRTKALEEADVRNDDGWVSIAAEKKMKIRKSTV